MLKWLMFGVFQVVCILGHGYEGYQAIFAFASLTGFSPNEVVGGCELMVIVSIIFGPSIYDSLMNFSAMNLPEDFNVPDDLLEDDEEDRVVVEEEMMADATSIFDDPEFARVMLKNRAECTVA